MLLLNLATMRLRLSMGLILMLSMVLVARIRTADAAPAVYDPASSFPNLGKAPTCRRLCSSFSPNPGATNCI